MIYGGLWLILIGVLKKAVAADYIAQYVNIAFGNSGGYSGVELLMAILGYTMQIYCDFSGYSDMAIGIASIMGFKLPQNFDFPYRSLNVTEFWRRWHMSLSFWLRDYIYISLGGNRKGKWRQYINLMATMLIGGLWHGAAWKFLGSRTRRCIVPAQVAYAAVQAPARHMVGQVRLVVSHFCGGVTPLGIL